MTLASALTVLYLQKLVVHVPLGKNERTEPELYEQFMETHTLESRIIGGVGIIGGLDIVIIINNRGGGGDGV